MEDLKQECIERLKILEEQFGLLTNCRAEFKRKDTLYYSERTPLGGILYWVDNKQELVDKVKEFEKDNKVKVYFCLLTYTEFGTLFDMLYVTDEKEYWEEEKEDLKLGYAMSNCKNLTDDMMSDFGSIAIKGMSGGIIRIG